jgi:hypothetical protein
MAIVDLAKSPRLATLFAKNLEYSPTPENTVAIFVVERTFHAQISQRLGRPAIGHNDAILLAQIDEDFGIRATHIATSSCFRTTAVYFDHKKEDTKTSRKYIEQIDRFVTKVSKSVRGTGTSVLAWNGEHWGASEFRHNGNIVLRAKMKRSVIDGFISIGELVNFRKSPAESLLAAGIEHQYLRYVDSASSLVVPGVDGVITGSLADHIDFANAPDPYYLPASGGDLSYDATGEAGSAGGGGSSTMLYPDTIHCVEAYSNKENCESCCERFANGAGWGGGVIGTAIVAGTGGCSAVAIGGIVTIPGVVICAALGLAASFIVWSAVLYVCSESCKRAAKYKQPGQAPNPDPTTL